MTQDYKPNSHRFKEQQKEVATTEKKKVEKVVSGTAVKKRNDMRKLTDIFISEDAENVKSYIFMDVLVPAIKKAISDIVTDGIDMVLYGSTGRSRKNKSCDSIFIRIYSSSGGRLWSGIPRQTLLQGGISFVFRSNKRHFKSSQQRVTDSGNSYSDFTHRSVSCYVGQFGC